MHSAMRRRDLPANGGMEMRLLSKTVTILLAAATLGATASVVQAQSCQSLWVERNTYYKNAGYCFKTQRAISYFGNGGCRYNNEGSVPLSRAARNRIAQITALERRLGCSD
jgi:hypothetical protein